MSLLHGLLAAFFPPMAEPIDELRPGAIATVRGRVVPRDVIESPLDGERCVYYHYSIEEYRRSGVVGTGAEGFWQLIDRDEAIVEFYLQDAGKRRAIVAPQRASIDRGRGVKASPIDLAMHDRRAQQLVIRPGDYLEVTGMVETVDDLFGEDRIYRVAAALHMLRAPAGGTIDIRLLPGGAE